MQHAVPVLVVGTLYQVAHLRVRVRAVVDGAARVAPAHPDAGGVAAALVGRAIRAQESSQAMEITGHILNYAGSFPQREMGVMLVSDLHRAIGEALFQVPEFASWANAIADVMLYE